MPSPITLPASRWRARIGGQQHLDHARGLLLDHAHGDEVAVADQLAVEHHRGEERQPPAVRCGSTGSTVAARSGGGASAARCAAGSDRRSAAPRPARTWRLATWSALTSVSSGFSCGADAAPGQDHVDVAVGERLRRLARRDRLTSISASNSSAPRAAAWATGSAAGRRRRP